jgi:hypothetical protein
MVKKKRDLLGKRSRAALVWSDVMASDSHRFILNKVSTWAMTLRGRHIKYPSSCSRRLALITILCKYPRAFACLDFEMDSIPKPHPQRLNERRWTLGREEGHTAAEMNSGFGKGSLQVRGNGPVAPNELGGFLRNHMFS